MKTLFLFLLACSAAALAETTIDVLIENDHVLVRKVTVSADHSTGFHEHESNRVMLYLDEGGQSTIRQDGPTTIQKWAAGEPLWSPATGMHRVEITAPGRVTTVQMELRRKGPAQASVLSDLHPLKADPEHYQLEFENDQVRVIRVKFPAGAAVPLHEHRNPRIVTYLTDADLNSWDESGALSRHAGQARDVSWGDDVVRHHEKNVSNEAFEAVVVELK